MKTFLRSLIAFVIFVNVSIAQWTRLPGPNGAGAKAVYVADTFMLGAAAGKLLRSTDNGVTWPQVSGAAGLVSGEDFVRYRGKLYLGGSGAGTYVSLDDGVSWDSLPISFEVRPYFSCFIEYKNRLLAGCSFFIVRLDDTVWNLHANDYLSRTASMATDGTRLYVGTEENGVWLSDDDGVTWRVSKGTDDGTYGLAMLATDSFVLAGFNDSPLLRSTDRGETWTRIKIDTVFTGVAHLEKVDNLLIAGTGHGVYTSSDGGLNWTARNEGVADPSKFVVSEVFVHRDTVYIGTNQWIWKRPLAELLPQSSVESPTAGVRSTTLGQSIPNPARAEASIPYALATSGPVTLTVYDAMLQEVRVVVDAQQEAGPHTVRFSTESLPNGVYYYRLNAGGLTLTKRMIVLR